MNYLPHEGTNYFYPVKGMKGKTWGKSSFDTDDGFKNKFWDEDKEDVKRYKAGECYQTKENLYQAHPECRPVNTMRDAFESEGVAYQDEIMESTMSLEEKLESLSKIL